MTREQALSGLLRFTHGWLPSASSTPADQHAARMALGMALLADQSVSLSAIAPTPPPVDVATETAAAIIAAVDAAAVELARIAPSIPPTVFVRALSIRTPLASRSVPSWAAGRRATSSLGPFVDERGLSFWVDSYESAPHVAFVRNGSSRILALIPIESAFRSVERIDISQGTVWLSAQEFDPAAPAGYIGIAVDSGEATLDGPSTGSNPIELNVQGSVTLRLELAVPVATGPVEARGSLPARVTFRLAPAGGSLLEAEAAALQLSGVSWEMNYTEVAARFEPAVRSMVFPFVSNRTEHDVAEGARDLYTLAGKASVETAGWIIPVTDVDPEKLGEAEGAGGVGLILKPGITAAWLGLQGGVMRLNRVTFLAFPDLWAIAAPGADNRRNRVRYKLWPENEGSRSSVTMGFETPHELIILRTTESDSLLTLCSVETHADRPVLATGSRIAYKSAQAALTLSRAADTGITHASLLAEVPQLFSAVLLPTPLAPLALANALLRTTSPRLLSLSGVVDADLTVSAGVWRLEFGLYSISPFLPDPYAANLRIEPVNTRGEPPSLLGAFVHWSASSGPDLGFRLAPRDESVRMHELLPIPLPPTRTTEQDRSVALQNVFNEVLRSSGVPGGRLLDVSSQADQLGVALVWPGARTRSGFPVTIEALDLATVLRNTRVLLLPQVQWEPVRTEPQPIPPFPKIFYSNSDGGPTWLGAESVALTPIAPIPVADNVIQEYRNNAPAAALFTLPFGIKAVARLDADRTPPGVGQPPRGPILRLNQPQFGELDGARQITLQAETPTQPKISAFLPGAAMQTNNGANAQGNPANVLDLANFFDGSFGPTPFSPRPLVPLSRIDFSGYGASCFSEWADPSAVIGVSMVRFDVLRGRTAYEVVRVKSILWPCQAPVVREITMERKGHGVVIRSDSGWVATGPGLFETPGSQCVFHPGVVKGYYDIREIRDTRNFILPPGAKVQAVYFDADIAIETVTRGQARSGVDRHGEPVGFVPAINQVGYVQHEPISSPAQPQGVPLSPAQLAALIAQVGPIGGALSCETDVGESGQRMSVHGVYANSVPHPTPAAPAFALAAHGTLSFRPHGQWSLCRVPLRAPGLMAPDEAEPLPVDPQRGLPLIREGAPALSRAGNPAHYRFADPADLLRPQDPDADYGLLYSAEAHRVFFPRPIIRRGEKRLSSERAPILADPYALLQASVLFPKAKHGIHFPNAGYALNILPEGAVKLEPSPLEFEIPQRTRELAKYGGGRMALEYFDTQPGLRLARVQLTIDPAANPPQALTLGPIGVLADMGPFPGLMRIVSRLEVRSPAQFVNPVVRWHPVIAPLADFFTVLQNLAFPAPLLMAMPFLGHKHSKLSFKLVINVAELMEMRHRLHPPAGPQKEKRAQIGSVKFGGGIKAGAEFDPVGPKAGASIEFEGEFQKMIFPGLFVGGFMKFAVEANSEHPDPKYELAMGVVGSIGGDLIKDLIEVEATVKYGYLLVISDKIRPGVIVGMEVKAEIAPKKIPNVKGLIGLAFEWEGQALLSIEKNPDEGLEEAFLEIDAEIKVGVSLELALFIEIEFELETQFHQRISFKVIAALGIALGVGLIPPP